MPHYLAAIKNKQPMFSTTIPTQIQELISRGALFVINDSAGKDSQAMKIHLMKIIPHNQLVIVHANLPGVEWDGNMDHIRKYSGDLPVHEVQAGKTFFEMVERRGKFPSASTRQCTSDLKRDPIQKFINHYAKANGFSLVVNCMGIRADESPARSKQIPLKKSDRNCTRAREQWQWLPIFDMTIRDVWSCITIAGQKRHHIYNEGMSRLSCCFCIMSSKQDLRTAARLNPELAEKYMGMEEKLNFTMSMDGTPLRQILSASN